jgi:serine/threonine protein kinase
MVLALNCATCGQALDEQSRFCNRCGRPTPNSGSPRRSGPVEPTFVAMKPDTVMEGKWRLDRKLGEGGMGTVYLAHDLQLDRPVAIKILSSGLVGDGEVMARFEREARFTASLDHPHIVPVYAVGQHEGRPFMVMKRLEGETLAAVLHERGALSPEETVSLFRQLASGLDYIHAKGYVHRDIKAGNIFVGPDGLATILDFGILRSARSAETFTRAGVVMGTPQYMSPEQAMGARDVDHRADLYALAVVLFECLTGTLPFEGDSELKIIQMQAHSPPPELITRAPWAPQVVSDVVKRALAKKPEDRYGSGRELVQALEAAYREAGTVVPSTADLALPPSNRNTLPGAPHISQGPRPADPLAPVVRGELLLTGGFGPSRGRGVVFAVLGLLLIASAAAVIAVSGGDLSRLRARVSLLDARGMLDAGVIADSFLATVTPVPTPPAVEPAPAPAPEEPGTTAADAPPPPPAEVPLPAEAPPGETAEAPPAESPAPADPEAPARKPERRRAASSGKLNIITTFKGEPYWADVQVNGVAKGRTPRLLELPPGKHTVKVERTGFKSQQRQITVASGRSAVLRISLTP